MDISSLGPHSLATSRNISSIQKNCKHQSIRQSRTCLLDILTVLLYSLSWHQYRSILTITRFKKLGNLFSRSSSSPTCVLILWRQRGSHDHSIQYSWTSLCEIVYPSVSRIMTPILKYCYYRSIQPSWTSFAEKRTVSQQLTSFRRVRSSYMTTGFKNHEHLSSSSSFSPMSLTVLSSQNHSNDHWIQQQ